MCNPNVDELSVMTYLSQFPNCHLKPGAPLRPKTNPARVRAYGPGTNQISSIASRLSRTEFLSLVNVIFPKWLKNIVTTCDS